MCAPTRRISSFLILDCLTWIAFRSFAHIRASSQVPILVTSARDRGIGTVAALNAGANDYLRKPFVADDLLKRVDLLVRYSRRSHEPGKYDFVTDHLRVNYGQKKVFHDRQIQLSPTEFGLLHSLIAHAGGVVTLDQLRKDQVTSSDENAVVDVRVGMSQLWRKLESDVLAPRFLLAEPGIGYRLTVN